MSYSIQRRVSLFLLLLSPDRGVTIGAMQPPPGQRPGPICIAVLHYPCTKPQCAQTPQRARFQTASTASGGILWRIHMGHKAPPPVPGVRRSSILLLLFFNVHLVSSFRLRLLIARFLGQQTSSLYVVSNTGADWILLVSLGFSVQTFASDS